MSLLSNRDLVHRLSGPDALVTGISAPLDPTSPNSPLEAASVRLTAGRMYYLKRSRTGDNELVETDTQLILREGGVAFVLTKEIMNFDEHHAGIMTPKSGGIAERGILITNTGHVDPGFKGPLRYAIINMGHEPFSLRAGDVITKLMIFQLQTPASPDWSELHPPIQGPTEKTIEPLGHDFLNIEERAERIAEERARAIFWELMGSWGLLAFVLALAIGVLGVAATLAASTFLK